MDFKRRLMAQPCKGSSARIFKRSRSRVPWTRSFGLLISVSEMSILQASLGKQEENCRQGYGAILACKYEENHPRYFSCKSFLFQSRPVTIRRQAGAPQRHSNV